jgi:NADPH:quinone reductase-like Zn-dependent oxidoreductase
MVNAHARILAMAKNAVGDLAGEVVELGSGVTNFKPGDKVISISFPVSKDNAFTAMVPPYHYLCTAQQSKT